MGSPTCLEDVKRYASDGFIDGFTTIFRHGSAHGEMATGMDTTFSERPSKFNIWRRIGGHEEAPSSTHPKILHFASIIVGSCQVPYQDPFRSVGNMCLMWFKVTETGVRCIRSCLGETDLGRNGGWASLEKVCPGEFVLTSAKIIVKLFCLNMSAGSVFVSLAAIRYACHVLGVACPPASLSVSPPFEVFCRLRDSNSGSLLELTFVTRRCLSPLDISA